MASASRTCVALNPISRRRFLRWQRLPGLDLRSANTQLKVYHTLLSEQARNLLMDPARRATGLKFLIRCRVLFPAHSARAPVSNGMFDGKVRASPTMASIKPWRRQHAAAVILMAKTRWPLTAGISRETAKSLYEAVTCGVAIRGMYPACLQAAGSARAERWKFSTLAIACHQGRPPADDIFVYSGCQQPVSPRSPCSGPGPAEGAPTFRRAFALVSADVLARVLGAWLWTRAVRAGGRLVIAIDGKTVRGARSKNRMAPHLVAALAHGIGAVLSQVAVDEKSNEIPAVESC